MQKKNTSVTRKEFMKAFNAASKKREAFFRLIDHMIANKKVVGKLHAERAAFNKKVGKIFPSQDPQSTLSVAKLRTELLEVARSFAHKDGVSLVTEWSDYVQIAQKTIDGVPKLKQEDDAARERLQEQEELRRRKETARFEARMNREETLKQRIARLERENAYLRNQGSDDHPCAKKEDTWASDNRMGGSSPQPGYRSSRD